MLSMISIVSATRFKDAPMRESPSKIKNFFLTIIPWDRGYSEYSCLENEGHCQTVGEEAMYTQSCYWDGSCHCDSFMNDEALFTTKCNVGFMDVLIANGICVSCTYGDEQCSGEDLLVCRGCQYENMGKVGGKCGYEQVCDRYGIGGVDKKCGYDIYANVPPYQGGSYIDNHYYTCLKYTTGPNAGEFVWYDEGLQIGECGIECLQTGGVGCSYPEEICEDYLCKPAFVCNNGDKKCAEDNVIVCINNQWQVEQTCQTETHLCENGACVSKILAPTTPEITTFAQFFSSVWSWIKGVFN